jgi:Nif-specific regulatory protein
MTDVMTKIAKLAATDSTVLIEGETGTGKELVARAIHADSNRAAKPFIAVNCAALTETLLESELFGYEKGAFTGAATRKRGLFEAADGGCIFLDEIGELAPAMQAKLLRVLQQREFVRVGGTQATKVNVRVIAATNRDLRLMAKSGGFREDLFFRLSVVRIVLPPLRQRCDDIPALALHFLEKHARLCNRRVNGISRVVNEYLLRYSWPGNIRELENAIERAVVLGSGETILPEDLPETVLEQNTSEKGTGSSAVPNFHRAVLECKRELILKAVTQANGNLSEAARRLGLHPNYLHRLVTAMNLRTELIPKAAE